MPDAVNETIEVNFGIKEIRTTEFSIINVVIPGLAVDKMDFMIGAGTELDSASDTVIINCAVDVFLDESHTQQLAHLVSSTTYYLRELKSFLNKEKGTFTIPDPLMHTFLSLALSTTRGILAAKTEGTVIQNVYLPIINPGALLQSMKQAAGNS